MTKSRSDLEYKPEKLTDGMPLYFVRTWGGPDDQPTGELPLGVDFVIDTRSYFPSEALTIYGYSIVSRYTEDQETAWRIWKSRRGFLSFCYSEICPEGEMGFTDSSDVVEIPEEDFLAAKERGWKLP